MALKKALLTVGWLDLQKGFQSVFQKDKQSIGLMALLKVDQKAFHWAVH